MQSSRKIGILLLMLIVPVFLVLFFQFFSTSHYDIPTYYEHGIDSLAACESTQEVHQVKTLQTTNALTKQGQSVDFRKQIRLVYMLSGNCQDTCQLVLEELSRVQGDFKGQAELQFIVLGDSTFANVSEIAATYRQDTPEWLFLQGTEAQNQSFRQCELILPQPGLPLNATLVLIDGEGKIRGYYEGTLTEDVDRLIGEIRVLLYALNMKKAHANNAG